MRSRMMFLLVAVLLMVGFVPSSALAATTQLNPTPSCPSVTGSTVEFNNIEGDPAVDTAVTLELPGFTKDASFFDPINDTVKKYGDVVGTSYCGTRFDEAGVVTPAVADKIVALADSYDRVVILASSMGGDVAHRALQKIKHDHPSFDMGKIHLDLMSSPAGLLTLQFKQILQCGILAALPNGDYLEQNPTRSFLLGLGLHADQTTNYQVDESRFMAWFMAAPGSLAGLGSSTYFVSTQDETVNGPFAYGVWNTAANGRMKRVDVASKHVDVVGSNATWVAAVSPVMQEATGVTP